MRIRLGEDSQNEHTISIDFVYPSKIEIVVTVQTVQTVNLARGMNHPQICLSTLFDNEG